MKTFLSRATVVAVALAICLVNLQARAQNALRPSGTSVAVIDLGEVFKKHPRLKTQLEDIKTQIDAYEAFVRQEQTKIQAWPSNSRRSRPGTPDYADKEKAVRQSCRPTCRFRCVRRAASSWNRKLQIRYQAYQEIQQHVAKFCQTYGIQLVIRFNRNDDRSHQAARSSDGLESADRLPELAGYHQPHHSVAWWTTTRSPNR